MGMEENIYRLGEYKIIEDDTGQLRWEAHSGIGEYQEGKCYKKGMILFIGPVEGKGDGLLKLEFMDQLKKFPEWQKTKYYCESFDLYNCGTGKKVTRAEMQLWSFDHGSDKEAITNSDKFEDNFKDPSCFQSREGVAYRLKKYEINKKENGKILWKSFSGPSSIKTGTCIICDDILFVGPSENEQTDLNKQEFLRGLEQLPIWDQTKYFCPALFLNECKRINQVWGKKKKRLLNKKSIKSNPIRTYQQSNNLYKRVFSKPDRIFSANRLEALKSLPKLTTRYKNSVSFPRFKVKKPDILKSIVLFHSVGLKKWLTFSACFLLLAGLFFLFILFDHRENHYEKSHYKKGNYNSSNRRDH